MMLPSVFNIVDYGAVGDGETLNTNAIQLAINACAAGGGGMVFIPPGRFVSGSITLSGNITLHLASGAFLLGSTRLEDYPVDDSDWSVESNRAGLISVRNAEHVTIEGHGVIDGRGIAFVLTDRFKQFEPKFTDYDPSYTRQRSLVADTPFLSEQAPYAYLARPGDLIRFLDCRNVTIRDVTICNSPIWTVHVKNSQVVNIVDAHIHSYGSDRRVPNDDGIDINGCDDVRISGCAIHTGDDCIAVFGGERITVTNCTLMSRSAGIRVGWRGPDIKDAVFQNLVIHANRGIGIFVRGRGSIENVSFSQIIIRTQFVAGHWWGRGEPLHVSAMPRSPDLDQLGTIRGVRFHDIVAEAQSGIVVYGSEECPIYDLQFRNIDLQLCSGPLQAVCGGNFDMRPTADLSRALFAHDIPGLYARFVDQLSVERFNLSWAEDVPEYFSYGIACEDFEALVIEGFTGEAAVQTLPAIILNRGKQVQASRLYNHEGDAVSIQMNGIVGASVEGEPMN